MSVLLRFDGVACRRGGRLLFDGLDLAISPGDAVQVTGPNGSGKSSLLRLAAGLLRPERGSIERAPLALADDNVALDRERTLRQALGFWGGALDKAIEALALEPLGDVPVRLLSAGQAKRATLARVAASRAPLWLLDEPVNALDTTSAGLLGDLMERHRRSGGAILAASHAALPGEWRVLEMGR